MNNEHVFYYQQGLEVGKKLTTTNNKEALKTLINFVTAHVKNYESIRERVIEFCINAQALIPDFVPKLNEDNYLFLAAFLIGAHNGSLQENN